MKWNVVYFCVPDMFREHVLKTSSENIIFWKCSEYIPGTKVFLFRTCSENVNNGFNLKF